MGKKEFFEEDGEVKLADKVQAINEEKSKKTKDAIVALINNPDKENLDNAVSKLKDDKYLPIEQREDLIKDLFKKYYSLLNFENCPDSYEQLKMEAKYLAGITNYSFLLMAQRLYTIKTRELYKKDNHPDFKTFIEKEMNIGRRTAYNYIDIIEIFGVQALAHEKNLEFSKLIPIIPVLRKASISEDEKEIMKINFIEKAKNKSFRDITKDAKSLKRKYGLEKVIPEDDKKIKKIQEFIKYIENIKDMTDGENMYIKILKDKIIQLF